MRDLIMIIENAKNFPSRLFHGTCSRYLPLIKKYGLAATTTAPKSGPIRKGVYLTDDRYLAAEYGMLAIDKLDDSADENIVILEIDCHQLDATLLQPDDYDLHDAIHGGEREIDDQVGHLRNWNEASWQLSLAVVRQVLYAGAIPRSAIINLNQP